MVLVTPPTHELAHSIVARWQPQASVQPMTPGEAGLAPFKVTVAADSYCLKVPIVVDDAAKMTDRVAGLKREGKLARWAGGLTDVAPPVCHVDAETGAYAARFVPGQSPSHEEMISQRLPIFSTLRRLHAAAPHSLPAGHPSDDNWLLTRDVVSDLAKSKEPCSAALHKATVDLLNFVEDTARRGNTAAAVIHNDLHKGNVLLDGAQVRLIDMANLRLADPMVDVAHYCHELHAYDLDARPSIAALAADYTAAAPRAGLPEADADKIALHLARFDIRRQAFSRHWAKDAEMPSILRGNCQSLSKVFAERGFTAPQVFA